ncbi:methyltransferase domain-containing protein [Kitasatospora sp. NBC_01287]|uniref:methyltransferase domain-containing protein n=1 Tax=Kitasatospora sp. NBC_01287 TaxID=2903573 RepID=UPI00224FE591|nr:methyltransferase domain-containing protein [Kitasatospora sp. NBC_01287]MCX4750367.1 methyltransferase domain-containing protein [Kitasatospora sp. NBC_01287]
MSGGTPEGAGPAGLASALLASGALGSEWLGSFHAVPRELFVPERIWPGIADGTGQDPVVYRSVDAGAWWRAVYSDIPLTTQWDDGEHEGDGLGTTPSSSNSMPTMVFSMLRDLDVRPGDRVLEIGTGTGWNAGLLAHRLGDRNVVTVEYDPDVARGARENLLRAGLHPEVIEGDGRSGWAGGAPYDRVIATCSLVGIPPAWLEQTAPGGVIVAPFGTEYGGEGIVRLTVDADGAGASGRFTGGSAFMRLRQQRTDRPLVDAYLNGREWPADGVRSVTTLAPPETGGWSALFAIGLGVPGAFWRAERYADGAYTLWLYSGDTLSWATADYVRGRTSFEVVQSGPRQLWDEVAAAWQWWDDRGRPGFDRFGLTVTPSGHTAWLDEAGNPVPVRS